jgi:phosphate transport system substrate-binding protein
VCRRIVSPLALAGILAALGGCGPSGGTIQNKGSDTMLEVAQAWSEAYHDANVQVTGGGSGVGIAGFINGNVEVCNSSREMKAEEIAKVREKTGKDPLAFVVGYDALAIYVHKDNPLEEITLEQIKDVFSKDGKITKWSELGVKVKGCDQDQIVMAGRQNNSGTYEYFREAVLGKEGAYRLGILEQNGSRSLVAFVATTPCGIGYSGIGYKTDEVKVLNVKKKAEAPAVAPAIATVHDKSYPISRPMFCYIHPDAPPHIQSYMRWVRTKAGQDIVERIGYVPLPAADQVK